MSVQQPRQPPLSSDLQHPDWVMVGAPGVAGRFLIYASTTMDAAELWGILRDGRLHGFELRAAMADYVVAEGDTYAEALRRLLEFWSPSDPTRPHAITEPRRQLPPG